MSETASRGWHRHGRGRWATTALVVAVAAGAIVAWRVGAASTAAPPPATSAGGPGAPATARVVREDLSAVTPLAGTLGYAGSYALAGRGGGTLTWLPADGQVIRQGQPVYETGNGSPVVLLYGTVPDWRAMSIGIAGADVSQLNHDLVHSGYAHRLDIAVAGWDYYSAETAYGVQRLLEHLGVPSPLGSLSLGQVVFEPGAIRVAGVTGNLGGPASGPVLAATSTEHVVTVALDTAQESEVQVGDAVTVTLPDGASTPGVVSSVGAVATTSQLGSGGAVTTVPLQVRLTHLAAARGLDQAPVTVYITTDVARDVLAVPVTALLARPGGYVVEIAGESSGARHYVQVRVGIFDDSSGLVQVAGALAPGQRVVVAAT